MNDKKRFNAEEVIKIAIEIEKRGKAFYAGLLERFKDEAIADVFRIMTTEETKHEQLFTAFLQDFHKIRVKSEYDETREDIMSALASAHIFVDDDVMQAKIAAIKSPIDAIDLAIDFEKDSVVYFTGMKEYVFEDDQNIIDNLAKEEMLHVVRLLDMKKEFI